MGITFLLGSRKEKNRFFLSPKYIWGFSFLRLANGSDMGTKRQLKATTAIAPILGENKIQQKRHQGKKGREHTFGNENKSFCKCTSKAHTKKKRRKKEKRLKLYQNMFFSCFLCPLLAISDWLVICVCDACPALPHSCDLWTFASGSTGQHEPLVQQPSKKKTQLYIT